MANLSVKEFESRRRLFLDQKGNTEQKGVSMSDSTATPTPTPQAPAKATRTRSRFVIMQSVVNDFKLLNKNDQKWVLDEINSAPAAADPASEQ